MKKIILFLTLHLLGVINYYGFSQDLKIVSIINVGTVFTPKKGEKIPDKYKGATIDPYASKGNPFSIVTRSVKVKEKNNKKNYSFEVLRAQRGYDNQVDTDTDRPYPENQHQKNSLSFDQSYLEIPFESVIANDNEKTIIEKNRKISKLFRRGVPMLYSIPELSGILFEKIKEIEKPWIDSLSDGEYMYYNTYKVEETYTDSIKVSFRSTSSLVSNQNQGIVGKDDLVGTNGIRLPTNLGNTENANDHFEGYFVMETKKLFIKRLFCNKIKNIPINNTNDFEKKLSQTITIANVIER